MSDFVDRSKLRLTRQQLAQVDRELKAQGLRAEDINKNKYNRLVFKNIIQKVTGHCVIDGQVRYDMV